MADHTSIFSVLENPMDRGAWWATVHGVTKSRTWLSDFHFHYDSVTSIWGEGYSDSPSRALAVLSPPPSSLGWVLYSFYFISLKVTSLQGENGTRICQVSWPWDCNWEMPPSVHLLPEKCVQTDAGGGCKWSHQQDRGGLLFWCMMSQQQHILGYFIYPFWFSFQVVSSSGFSSAGHWQSFGVGNGWYCFQVLLRRKVGYFIPLKKRILRTVAY